MNPYTLLYIPLIASYNIPLVIKFLKTLFIIFSVTMVIKMSAIGRSDKYIVKILLSLVLCYFQYMVLGLGL